MAFLMNTRINVVGEIEDRSVGAGGCQSNTVYLGLVGYYLSLLSEPNVTVNVSIVYLQFIMES